jgi:hypothetical protein
MTNFSPSPCVINAFHPLYVHLFMPEFLKTIRKESDATENGKRYGKLATAQNHKSLIHIGAGSGAKNRKVKK